MEYNVTEKNNSVIIKNVKDFNLMHTFECGQCFRWERNSDESYTGVAKARVVNIRQKENEIVIDNCTIKDFEQIWHDYFDLGRDYGEIKSRLSKEDDVMRRATEFGSGIRLLNQDEWETLVSFIISQNRNIPLIKRSVEELSVRFGNFIEEYKGKKYYAFPSVEVLAKLNCEDLNDCKLGYRTEYVIETAKSVLENNLLYNMKNNSTEEAEKFLRSLKGVGPKVANCILLFSMRKYESFPIDVWVKRTMAHFYPLKESDTPAICKYAQDNFGNLGGFAQQYLFYYARETKGEF